MSEYFTSPVTADYSSASQWHPSLLEPGTLQQPTSPGQQSTTTAAVPPPLTRDAVTPASFTPARIRQILANGLTPYTMYRLEYVRRLYDSSQLTAHDGAVGPQAQSQLTGGLETPAEAAANAQKRTMAQNHLFGQLAMPDLPMRSARLPDEAGFAHPLKSQRRRSGAGGQWPVAPLAPDSLFRSDTRLLFSGSQVDGHHVSGTPAKIHYLSDALPVSGTRVKQKASPPPITPPAKAKTQKPPPPAFIPLGRSIADLGGI